MKVFLAALGLLFLTGCQTVSQLEFHPITADNKQFAVQREGTWYGTPKHMKVRNGFPNIQELLNINFSAINF